jgi:hypothetical protein
MKTLLAALLGAAMTASQLQAAVLYSYDDGTAEAGVRGGPPRPADLWIANGFTAVPGASLIKSIDIAYGTPFAGTNPPINGLPVQILLYDDPTDDMNPTDAVLLTSVMTVAAGANTNTFINVPITPTAVVGDFFVAALMASPANGGLGGALDKSVTSLNVSWVAENTGGTGLINPLNVAGTSTFGPVPINTIPNSPGVFMIRANGVPEPTALAGALLACGLASAIRRRV